MITLSSFYKENPPLPLKQKIIKFLQKFVLKKCSAIVFSTEFQKNIFESAYGLDSQKLFIIENFYGEKEQDIEPKIKNFLWAGRFIKFKNIEMIKGAFDEARKERGDIELEISENITHEELKNKIKNCYAIIYSSLTEISPNFVLDAIGFSKPFITAKDCGFYDKLKNIGLFVNPLDKEDIKNKILFLAENGNYEQYQKKVAGFNFSHSWREIADEFIAIYKKYH